VCFVHQIVVNEMVVRDNPREKNGLSRGLSLTTILFTHYNGCLIITLYTCSTCQEKTINPWFSSVQSILNKLPNHHSIYPFHGLYLITVVQIYHLKNRTKALINP
jgi:hypothetical protein